MKEGEKIEAFYGRNAVRHKDWGESGVGVPRGREKAGKAICFQQTKK